MRHDKLGLQLELLLMLTENRQWTVEQMCERLDTGRRNLYYYLEFFKGADFGLVKHGQYYSISRQSKFISRLCDIVKFTEDEAVMLKLLLDGADDRSAVIRSVKQKLSRFYDFDIIENDPVRRHQAQVASKIYEAIKLRRVLSIRGYSSSHSNSVTDRKVEPFLLMNGGRDLRAYEPRSGINKTFRVSRMEDVEMLDEEWSHAARHRQMFNDYFNFASETLTRVSISMDQLAYHVLIEEYPRAEHDIAEEGGRWILSTEVCSMLGIGRFVLGLYDHVDIIDSPELEAYVRGKLDEYVRKQSLMPSVPVRKEVT
ncbi:MAG: WYL domain-containing protein [Bacteroidales bacterium]|nr:WYL domain-containing protein [Bacteroidales bacterium]MCM1146865.1 WYL domain-containing protein [Bacteroidales bacterium]MCM1205637.1 WYL domain-containing protein [Bacillota bacterium]MCM1510251.1 WYL domain-containing protein [Clostridium sp.]